VNSNCIGAGYYYFYQSCLRRHLFRAFPSDVRHAGQNKETAKCLPARQHLLGDGEMDGGYKKGAGAA